MKKILFITLSVLFVSCSNGTKSIRVVKEYKPTITYKYEKCSLRKGSGKVKQSTSEQVGMAIISMGATLISNEYVECPQCEGKGYVKVTDKIK